MLVNNMPQLEPEDLQELLVLFGADSAIVIEDNVQANRCPFHNNRSPTLGISTEFPYPVNCFNPACTARAPDVYSLVARFLNTDVDTAISWLYSKFPHIQRVKRQTASLFTLDSHEEEDTILETLPVSTMAAYDMSADKGIGYRAAEYYNGWTVEDCEVMGIGYDRINHRLIFPVYNAKGELVGLVGRNMQQGRKDRWYNYDKETFKIAYCLLGEHLSINIKYPLNICEGPSDYYQMLLLGVPNPRSVVGSEFSEWQVNKIAESGHPVNIIFDKDRAGLVASKKLGKRLREKGIKSRVIQTPDGVNDPRELTNETLPEFMQSIEGGGLFNFLKPEEQG